MNRKELMKLSKDEIIDMLLAIIQKQAEEIAELKARLNQNSKNSSKPPSSDGYKRPESLRTPSGKKAGGQIGHKGNGLGFIQKIDEYIQHEPEQCVGCEQASQCMAKRTSGENRYETDIEITTKTTAHQIVKVKCPKTGEELRGSFPETISSTMQYGVNIESLAVSLNTVGMVSIERTHELLSDIFNVPISTGTIAGMVSHCAEKVQEPVSDIKAALMVNLGRNR